MGRNGRVSPRWTQFVKQWILILESRYWRIRRDTPRGNLLPLDPIRNVLFPFPSPWIRELSSALELRRNSRQGYFEDGQDKVLAYALPLRSIYQSTPNGSAGDAEHDVGVP